jgi:hypothetical protein
MVGTDGKNSPLLSKKWVGDGVNWWCYRQA